MHSSIVWAGPTPARSDCCGPTATEIGHVVPGRS